MSRPYGRPSPPPANRSSSSATALRGRDHPGGGGQGGHLPPGLRVRGTPGEGPVRDGRPRCRPPARGTGWRHAARGGEGGTPTLSADGAYEALFNDLSRADAEPYLARLGAHTLAPFGAPVTERGMEDHPSTYLVCLQDRTFSPALQRRFAAHTTSAVDVDAGHSPMITRPAEVAAAIAAAARRRLRPTASDFAATADYAARLVGVMGTRPVPLLPQGAVLNVNYPKGTGRAAAVAPTMVAKIPQVEVAYVESGAGQVVPKPDPITPTDGSGNTDLAALARHQVSISALDVGFAAETDVLASATAAAGAVGP
ncbi:alpha/beta fold hydrolase [Pseudonocardia sp. RS010]|uniref:alpha/beta fold hydrolase n=1 Tax=Pseudonocardia sp. RS010 TaxID=3385979 RepID=UPI00399FB2DB